MNKNIDLPPSIKALKLLRTELQRRALHYICQKVEFHAGWKFNTNELAKYLGITRQYAWQLLQKFVKLGFLKSHKEVDLKVINIPTNLRPTNSKWTHYFVRQFYGVLPVLSHFFKTNCLPTNTVLNTNNTSNNKELITGKIDLKEIEQNHRPKLIEKYTQAAKKLILELPERRKDIEKVLKEVLTFEEIEEIDTPTTLLSFFTTPVIAETLEEMDKLEEIQQDLAEKREYWTVKQQRYWFGIKTKLNHLSVRLKELVEPIFDCKVLVLTPLISPAKL